MPCKLGVTGSIPGISSLSNGTIIEIPASYDLSCWWDVKLQINQPIIHLSIIFAQWKNLL